MRFHSSLRYERIYRGARIYEYIITLTGVLNLEGKVAVAAFFY